MKRLILLFAIAPVLSAGVVLADGCPAAPDHSASLSQLIEQVQAAETEMAAREISNRMWELWADAPDEPAQEMLDRGMSKRAGYDLLGAVQSLNKLIEYCPDYAEGYNQRAFANYLSQNLEAALVDLDRAIALSPNHIAALAGRALTLMGLQRLDEARIDLARALELNPWLPERGLAAPGGPLAPAGQDI
jgi:tetratricopeptide (TPR) repeat protein